MTGVLVILLLLPRIPAAVLMVIRGGDGGCGTFDVVIDVAVDVWQYSLKKSLPLD